MDTQADDYLAITRSLRAESIENKKLAFGNKNILGDESHQNSLDHNIFNDHSYLSESDNSYINKPESYEQNENNDKPFSSEMNQRNSLSAIRKSISKKASTLVNGSNQRILEQATKKALNNVALKMADSSNKKQSLKDPLNSSLLSKHLEGADHHKASKSFSNQKSRTNQTSARSRITKKNEINENIILVSQSNKSSAGRLKTQKNKAISMNNSFTEKLDSNTISTLNINIQNQTLPAPCSANQVDEIQKIRSLESYIEKNGIVEGSQHIETEVTEPFEDNIIEKYSMQLIGAIQKMSIRTFLTLRSIIKPNENILICCQAFVKLFAGLNEAIPPSFSIMENIEWENIKVLFNSPVKILKLISTLSVFIEYKKIPQRNINAAIAALSKIPYELDDIQNEAFYQLYEYIVSAIEYYKYYKPKNIPSGEFNWASVQATPTMRVSTLHQESPIHTAESTRTISPNRKKKASMISCQESPSLRTMTSPDIKSKTPLRQLKSNLFTKSTCASTRRKAGVTVSPFKTPPSCKSVHGLPRNPSLQDVNNEKKSTLTNSVTLKMNQSAKSSISPLRSFTNSMQNKRTHESLESQYFTQATTECDQDFNNTKSLIMKTDVSEAANFFDEISQKRRESLSYKAKVSRLLADHERYIKKTLKSQEEERERAEREFHSYDRTKFEEYQERIKKEEEIYERDLKREEFQAQREAKVQKAKVHQLKINDEMMETTKHRVFITAQAEKKKHEKKKELWDQYKKKMEEKLAKKQKEANIIQAQKKEAYDNKIENVEWKKKQAAQEKEKWANNYLILSKLIGEAK